MHGVKSLVSVACALAAIAAVVGCSSSHGTNGATQAGDDGGVGGPGTGDDGGPPLASDGLPLCGTDEAGSVLVGITVTGIVLQPPPPPVPNAVFTSPSCPGISYTTDANGKMKGHVPKGVPFYGRLEAKGYVPSILPEQLFTADTPDISVTLPPGVLLSLIPGYDASKGTIFIEILKDGGKGACDQLDGVTLSVQGHPEVAVTYYSADTVPTPVAGATATTTGGEASITGLPLGSPVQLVATKPGCTAVLQKPPTTGRSPLEAGFVTLAGVYLH